MSCYPAGEPVASGVESVVLDEGSTNVTVSCLTRFNFPAGTVRWFRQDSQPLPPSRFSVNPSGQLAISTVLREDSGMFSCVVQNQYGMSSAVGTITVNCELLFTMVTQFQDVHLMADIA